MHTLDTKELEKYMPDNWPEGLDMSAALSHIETALPQLLNEPDQWHSMMIDYEPPYLMRVFRKIDITPDKSIYINLHYFFSVDGAPVNGIENPYKNGKTATEDLGDIGLYHPHPWAAGFKIVSGEYTQRIGMATDRGLENRPEPNEKRIQKQGSTYAFNDPHIWHIVLPNGTAPIMTLMATYIPKDWNQKGPKPKTKQRALTPQEKAHVLNLFKEKYPNRTQRPRRTITHVPRS